MIAPLSISRPKPSSSFRAGKTIRRPFTNRVRCGERSNPPRMRCPKIPEMTYRIIYAHLVEEQSFVEIAASLGLPAKQARDRYHRAIKRFRRLLLQRM